MVSAPNKDMTWDQFFEWTEAALQSHDIDALSKAAEPLMNAIWNLKPYTERATSYSIRVADQLAENKKTEETARNIYFDLIIGPHIDDATAPVRKKLFDLLNKEPNPFKCAKKHATIAGSLPCPPDLRAELAQKIQALEPTIEDEYEALQASAWAALYMEEGTEQKTQAIEHFKNKVEQLKTAEGRVAAYQDVANDDASNRELRHICVLGLYQDAAHLIKPFNRIATLRTVTRHVANSSRQPGRSWKAIRVTGQGWPGCSMQESRKHGPRR